MESVGVLLIITIYFIPSVIASMRDHHSQVAIFLVNLLLGWMLIGWVVAIVWACTGTRKDLSYGRLVGQRHVPEAPASQAYIELSKSNVSEEIERLHSLKEKGAITEEEYLAQKHRLLS